LDILLFLRAQPLNEPAIRRRRSTAVTTGKLDNLEHVFIALTKFGQKQQDEMRFAYKTKPALASSAEIDAIFRRKNVQTYQFNGSDSQLDSTEDV